MKPADLAYWNVNLPPSKHTADCPEALRTVGDKDRGIIGTLDADYAVMSWEDVCQLVAAMRLDQLRRVPSQLRAYLIYCWDLRKSHGSVMAFLLRERLSWSLPLQPSGKPPFEDPEDIRILWNDWPYGIDPKIVHLVVWTKFELEDDPVTGLVSDKARRQIDEFVAKTFYGRVPRERVSVLGWLGEEAEVDGERFACGSLGLTLLWLGGLVQELGVAKVGQFCRALSRHAP